MWETFFGFKKTPFSDSPDARQLFASAAWQQVHTRLQFLAQHHGVGLLTGEVGAGKSTAARVFTTALNPNLYKVLYIHFSAGTALDMLRQIALALDLEPAHFRGDLVRQIADAIVRLNQSKKQHPILICDEAHLLPHPALEQFPLLLNFDMDSSRYLTLLLIGHPLLRRTLSLQMHEALRQRVATHYHLEGLTRDELDAYLAQQLKAAGVSQPLFDDTARQALYQATKGIPRKVNKLAIAALRLAADRKASSVAEAVLLTPSGRRFYELTSLPRPRGIEFRAGSRPPRMPKADATGLAPKKSAQFNPRPFTGAGGFCCWSSERSHFFGGASERRPWAFKREDRPKGDPNLKNLPANKLRTSGGKIVTGYSTKQVGSGSSVSIVHRERA